MRHVAEPDRRGMAALALLFLAIAWLGLGVVALRRAMAAPADASAAAAGGAALLALCWWWSQTAF